MALWLQLSVTRQSAQLKVIYSAGCGKTHLEIWCLGGTGRRMASSRPNLVYIVSFKPVKTSKRPSSPKNRERGAIVCFAYYSGTGL